MKKNILLFILGFSFVFANAQSIEFRIDSLGASVNGQTIVKHGSPSDWEIVQHLWAVQTSGATMSIGAKSYELTIAGQITHTLCWAYCYTPLSPGVSNPFIAPDSLDVTTSIPVDNFAAHYYPNNNAGVSKFRYVLYDDNNPSDSAFVDVIFNTYPLSVGELTAGDVKLSAYPNPATNNLTIKYAINGDYNNAKLDMFDVLGQKVISKDLSSHNGLVQLSVESLNSGVYFYAIKVDEQTVKTERVIIR